MKDLFMQYETKREPPLSLHTKKWKYPDVYIVNRQKAKAKFLCGVPCSQIMLKEALQL